MPERAIVPTVDQVSPADYTPEMLEADLRHLCETYPTNRNPLDPATESCAYRASEGMCLIGLWLDQRGHAYDPEWENTCAGAVLYDLDYDEPVTVHATRFQLAADNSARPLLWGDVKVVVR